MLAYNENTKELNLAPATSKMYGLPPPSMVSTSLAYDWYQGLFAYGCENQTIKLLSLKGYEAEIYEAHKANIRCLQFVPNQGALISVDESNEVAVWDLRDLMKEPERIQIPLEEEGECVVTKMYATANISNEPDNHRTVYFAMSSGNIYIMDWKTASFSPQVIQYA